MQFPTSVPVKASAFLGTPEQWTTILGEQASLAV
jgi:hypothetical protein